MASNSFKKLIAWMKLFGRTNQRDVVDEKPSQAERPKPKNAIEQPVRRGVDDTHPKPDKADKPKSKRSSQLRSRRDVDTTDSKPTSGQRKRKPVRQQLVLGIDFGTAYTKAVIGETRKHYAVPFDNFSDHGNPYLLRGRFFVDEEGHCSLSSTGGREITNLKMRILDNRCNAEDEIELAAFMALVMRHARQWILSEHEKLYCQSEIDWLINVGLPTDSYHDDTLVKLYRHMTRAAWAVSFGNAPITLSSVEDRFVELACDVQAEQPDEIAGDDSIHLFPEFVAQITGYVRSPMRQNEKLHMLVDVGAGTVDISLFNVMEVDGEDRFPIMARAVERMGTAFLMRGRLEAAGRSMQNIPAHLPVPPRAVLAKNLGASESVLKRSDQLFRDKLLKRIKTLLNHTKEKRDPMAFGAGKKLTTFLCGGGSRVDLYQEMGRMISAPGLVKIEMVPLTIPDALDAPKASSEEYDRLSVAYGLSFDPFDIGDIVRTNEIGDIDPEPDPDSGLSNHPDWYKC